MQIAPRVEAPAAGPPMRIAAVDDDASEHTLVSIAVQRAEFDAEIVYYSSGETLLDVLRDPPVPSLVPEVILLDLELPGMHGYEILDQLAADAELRQLPVVVFTSSTDPDEPERALGRGAASFAVKSHDFYSMADMIETLPGLIEAWEPD